MKIHSVLVRTENPRNIGAAARAVANMGGDRLILIDPRCEWDVNNPEVWSVARDHIGSIIHYASWSEFYKSEGEGLRIALTRRGGGNRKVTPFKEELSVLNVSDYANLYLIFGPEADGLDSDDLAFVNFSCHLPVYGAFGSLNLAQAVMLALYLAREKFPPATLPTQTTDANEPAVKPLYFPDALIKEWLTAMGFDIRARRSSAYLTLRRLFLQNLPTKHEIQVLESILQQNIRKLRDARSKNLVGFATEQLTDDLGDVARKDI